MRQRVQKIIAASGYCSRRKAEDLIRLGKVTVNGTKISIGDQADPERDVIMIGKQRIIVEDHISIMLHKPSNYLTTRSDLWGRRSVMALVEDVPKNIYPIGRLDRDARGILLMTSDGDFAQSVLHPSKRVNKTYQARLDKPLSKEAQSRIRAGVIVDGRRVIAKLKVVKPKLVEITIHEGRNKIVKKIFKSVGHYVHDLKRIAIGKLRLDIPEGAWRALTDKDKEKIFM